MAERAARHVVVVDNSALAKRVGDRIRIARERAGLTQAQLAGDRYTAAYVSALERGLAKPSLASMAYLAPRLRVSVADLVAEVPAEPVNGLDAEDRVRIHERIQEASGLISQAADDLPHGDARKVELKDLGDRVWALGYEILGAVRYESVDELAKVIADLDEDQPFLSGAIDGVDLFDASPRRVAERWNACMGGRPPMAEQSVTATITVRLDVHVGERHAQVEAAETVELTDLIRMRKEPLARHMAPMRVEQAAGSVARSMLDRAGLAPTTVGGTDG